MSSRAKSVERWFKKNTQIENYKKEKKKTSETIMTFKEQYKKYQESHKTEQINIERIISKSDSVITYLHNAALELARSVSKVLHGLISKAEFNMMDILDKIVTVDMKKIHEWTIWFHRNEFLKKHKIFRNMNEKLNFYKKLEFPTLQKAYNRILEALKPSETLADKGEFSILDRSEINIMNQSVLSKNTSVNSTKNKSMEFGNYTVNILDELSENHASVLKRDSISALVTRLSNCITGENLSQMSHGALTDCIKKLQTVSGNLKRATKHSIW